MKLSRKQHRGDLSNAIFDVMKKLILYGLTLFLVCCTEEKPEPPNIGRSIAKHFPGGIEDKRIDFKFRDRYYSAQYQGGMYCFTRFYKADDGTILDTLDNEGFRRYLNDTLLAQTQEGKEKYAEGLNGVIYFAFLPHRLQDPAAKSLYKGMVEIEGKEYSSFEVSFNQEGGGSDFTDQFRYWIHCEDSTLDYFAYKYFRDGGGIRFRKYDNRRWVKGLLLQDYLNYKPRFDDISLDSLPNLYMRGALEQVSEIRMEQLKVSTID